MCSTTFGPAIVPDFVTCPTMNTVMPEPFAKWTSLLAHSFTCAIPPPPPQSDKSDEIQMKNPSDRSKPSDKLDAIKMETLNYHGTMLPDFVTCPTMSTVMLEPSAKRTGLRTSPTKRHKRRNIDTVANRLCLSILKTSAFGEADIQYMYIGRAQRVSGHLSSFLCTTRAKWSNLRTLTTDVTLVTHRQKHRPNLPIQTPI